MNADMGRETSGEYTHNIGMYRGKIPVQTPGCLRLKNVKGYPGMRNLCLRIVNHPSSGSGQPFFHHG